jgi:hypothetical protein
MDTSFAIPSERFAKCIASSKRVRWDIETDVIRGRRFDGASKFLPGRTYPVAPPRLPVTGGTDLFPPGPRAHLRQHFGADRALHRRQGVGAQPGLLVGPSGHSRLV